MATKKTKTKTKADPKQSYKTKKDFLVEAMKTEVWDKLKDIADSKKTEAFHLGATMHNSHYDVTNSGLPSMTKVHKTTGVDYKSKIKSIMGLPRVALSEANTLFQPVFATSKESVYHAVYIGKAFNLAIRFLPNKKCAGNTKLIKSIFPLNQAFTNEKLMTAPIDFILSMRAEPRWGGPHSDYDGPYTDNTEVWHKFHAMINLYATIGFNQTSCDSKAKAKYYLSTHLKITSLLNYFSVVGAQIYAFSVAESFFTGSDHKLAMPYDPEDLYFLLGAGK